MVPDFGFGVGSGFWILTFGIVGSVKRLKLETKHKN